VRFITAFDLLAHIHAPLHACEIAYTWTHARTRRHAPRRLVREERSKKMLQYCQARSDDVGRVIITGIIVIQCVIFRLRPKLQTHTHTHTYTHTQCGRMNPPILPSAVKWFIITSFSATELSPDRHSRPLKRDILW